MTPAQRSGPLRRAFEIVEELEARQADREANVWEQLSRSRANLRAAIDGLSTDKPRLTLIQGGKA